MQLRRLGGLTALQAVLLASTLSGQGTSRNLSIGSPIRVKPIDAEKAAVIDDAFPLETGEVAVLLNGFLVMVVDPSLEVAKRFGQAGAGPGETRAAHELAVLPGGIIVLGDNSQARLVFRTSNGKHLRDVLLDKTWTSMAAYKDGVLLRTMKLSGNDRIEAVERFVGPSGAEPQDFFRVSGARKPNMSGRGLFCSHCAVFAGTSGTIVIVPAEPEYKFVEMRRDGSKLRTFTGPKLRTIPPDPAVVEKMKTILGRTGGKSSDVSKLMLPFRPFTSTRAGGFDATGRLWVLRSPPDLPNSVLDVFGPDRKFLGSVQLTQRLIQARVNGNFLVGVVRDSNDVPSVFRFQLPQ